MSQAPISLQALSLPDLYRLATQLRAAVRPEPTEAVLREILARQPDAADVRFSLAYQLLGRGAFDEAWPLYEARTEVPDYRIRKPQFSFPEWRGEPVGSLLIYPEQGHGDQIMFARYAALLKRRGVAVTMVAAGPLVRLFRTLGVTVLEGAQGLSIPRCDAWALAGSLPRFLGVHTPGAYFTSPPGGQGIGVVVKGSPIHVKDAQRSLPLDLAAELKALPGAVSLEPEDTGAGDFEDTRRLIGGLEQVIAVDTAVAHLAAAMGKPVRLLVHHDPDWRWGWAGETTPWYPSVRIIRQATPGDWRGVLDQLRREL
jgi:Glycosyltransferase family 9 (heptosyltransferase)